MTLFDFGALNQAFGSMPGDPNWNPDADLDGDDEVSLFDFGILTANFGLLGSEEFAGSAQSGAGGFTATVRVELGDWTGQTARAVYVLLQWKRVGTEDDPSTPVYEQVVAFGQGEVAKDVVVRVPVAGIYTVRALAYNDQSRTDISHWLRSELTGLVVPQGGGTPRNVPPAPGWAEDVIPMDSVSAGGMGPSSASAVNLASGTYEHVPPPDLEVPNPFGPAVIFARRYSSWMAQAGLSSSGLGVGWKHSLDLFITWDRLSNPTTATLYYSNGSVESLGVTQQGASYRLSAPEGAPYAGLAEADNGYPGGWRITLFYRDYSRLVFAPVSTQSVNIFRLVSIVDRKGNAVGLYYQDGLLRYVRAGSSNLLELVYDTNGVLLQAKGYDVGGNNYATVTYTHQLGDDGNRYLVQVSQVNAPASLRWGFGYNQVWTRQDGSRVRLLTHVSAPDPRGGSGILTVPVAYDANGMVQMLVDANGHARRYVYHSNGTTDVEVYNGFSGELDFGWTQKLGVAGVDGGIVDALQHQSQLLYTNTYLPTTYTNRNGQTFTMTRDAFGNPLTVTTPRGIRWTFSYNYPQTYPIDPMVSLTVSQTGYDGSQRTPTVYEFYQTTDVSQGAVKGLLARVLSPHPGTAGTGEQVETRFYYTAQGNVAMISAPGPNNVGRRLTTVFYYTIDPWGGGPFAEGQDRPVAVAVYDKTLTLVDYQAIPSNPSLRDDRLIFLERYRYDARGNVEQIADGAGFVTTLQYNPANQLVSVTYPPDALNGVQAHERLLYRYTGGPLYGIEVWDVLNNPNNAFRTYLLGAGSEGEARSFAIAATSKADMGYDAHYRLRGVQGGQNASTGQRHTTQYTYTEQNFAQSTIYPNNDTYAYTQHDNEGNPLQRLDADGLITRFIRDIATDSRLERIEYPDATGNVTVEYDGFNRIRRLSRFVSYFGAPIVVEYAYDDNDLITTVRTTYPGLAPKEVTYTYYPDGSRASMSVAGATFGYEYSYVTGTLLVTNQPFAGLQVRVRLPVSTGFNLDSWYDQRGLLRRERTSGGVYREYHYNGRGLLTHLYNRYSATVSNIYADFTNLLYDAAGNVVQMEANIPAFGGARALQGWVFYGYDNQDRQTSEEFLFSDNRTRFYLVDFAYDGNDNPLSMRNVPFVSNRADQIANSGWQYSNGDLVQMQRFWEQVLLEYNREHQLTRYYNVSVSPPLDIRYFYSPEGLLAGRIGPNYFRWYLYDGSVPVAEVDGTNGSMVLLYAYGPEGLTQRFAPNGSQRRLYTFDPFGSVVHRVDYAAGYPNVLSESWHDRLGTTYMDVSGTGANPFPTPDVLDGYLGRFGQFRDPATRPQNLVDLTGLITTAWGTMYDPMTGRFASRTGGSQNPYARLYRPEKNFADANWNLVVAFAAAGYNSGDPSVDEGTRFLSGLDALTRLALVGSEWASYASPVAGSGRRAIAQEVAEEASERLVRQGAREAEEEWVRVGRWMSKEEYEEMLRTGRAVRSRALGETNVAYPANPLAYMRQAQPGTYYVEFEVPKSSIFPKGSGWATLRPTALEIRKLRRLGLSVPEPPAVRNIRHLATRIRLPGQP